MSEKDIEEENVLKDISKNGKERPWREKKIDNISYSEILELLEMKKAYNVRDCAEVLEFKENKSGGLKLYRAWFCKSKLCPICNWRRSMKNSYQAQKVVEAVMKAKPKSDWLFLTLTSKNSVDGQWFCCKVKKYS